MFWIAQYIAANNFLTAQLAVICNFETAGFYTNASGENNNKKANYNNKIRS